MRHTSKYKTKGRLMKNYRLDIKSLVFWTLFASTIWCSVTAATGGVGNIALDSNRVTATTNMSISTAEVDLTASEKARIRADEIYRQQIRKQLEDNQLLLKPLQSPLVVTIVNGVLIAIFIKRYDARSAEKTRSREALEKRKIEAKFQVNALKTKMFDLAEIPKDLGDTSRTNYLTGEATKIIRGRLEGGNDDLRMVLTGFRSNVDPKRWPDIDALFKGLDGVEEANTELNRSVDPYNRPSKETKNAVRKLQNELKTVLDQWKKILSDIEE